MIEKIKNLFKFKNSATDDTSSQSMTLSDLIDFFKIGNIGGRKRVSEVTCFTCLKKLQEGLSKMSLHVMQHTEEGGIRKATEHSLYSVVNLRPNSTMNTTFFLGITELLRNRFGNAYVYIRRKKNKTSLCLLDSTKVKVWWDDANIWSKEDKVWYLYTASDGKTYKLCSDEVMHFKTLYSEDGFTGLTIFEILRDVIDGQMQGQVMQNKLYETAFTAKATVQYTGSLSNENEKKLMSQLEDYAKSKVDNLKGIIPLPFGWNMQPLNTKLSDNQFVELKKYGANQIAAAFGIKPNQINDYDKSSYANSESQQLAFYVDTMQVIIKQYEEEMTIKLLTEEERKQGYFIRFNVASALRSDTKTQMEVLKTGVNNAIYTPNEARNFIDLESKTGGDNLICNGNYIPVTDVGKQYDKSQKGGE